MVNLEKSISIREETLAGSLLTKSHASTCDDITMWTLNQQSFVSLLIGHKESTAASMISCLIRGVSAESFSQFATDACGSKRVAG